MISGPTSVVAMSSIPPLERRMQFGQPPKSTVSIISVLMHQIRLLTCQIFRHPGPTFPVGPRGRAAVCDGCFRPTSFLEVIEECTCGRTYADLLATANRSRTATNRRAAPHEGAARGGHGARRQWVGAQRVGP